MAALKEVSRHYGRPLKGIKFGLDFKKEWPARGGWDLADPMPEKLFRGKRWIGPTLKSLKCFATYATEKVPVEEGKKGGPQPIVLKKWFAEEWVHSVTPDAYI